MHASGSSQSITPSCSDSCHQHTCHQHPCSLVNGLTQQEPHAAFCSQTVLRKTIILPWRLVTSQTWLGGMLLEPWKEWPGNVSKFPHEFQVRFFDPEHPERGGGKKPIRLVMRTSKIVSFLKLRRISWVMMMRF